jgi:cysteine desulfurase
MPASSIYLDYNATTPVKPAVMRAVVAAMELGGNPSSVHGVGRKARRAIEDARAAVSEMVGADPESVIFTASGTEANHLALLGAGRFRVLTSATEHNSVLLAKPDAQRIPVDASGLIDLEALERALAQEHIPALVSVTSANNETGVLQPIAAIVEIARRHGALVHTDAAQAPGRIKLNFRELGVDMMTVSAHKIGGVIGAAALVLRAGAPLVAIQRGGGQERGLRAGTENVAAIVGFGAAADLTREDLCRVDAISTLRDRLETLCREANGDAVVAGAGALRLPNTSCLARADIVSETQVMALDLAGFAVSAGAACSSGKVRRSAVLDAMGLGSIAAHSIRISLGWDTRPTDIDLFAKAWSGLRARSKATSMALETV